MIGFMKVSLRLVRGIIDMANIGRNCNPDVINQCKSEIEQYLDDQASLPQKQFRDSNVNEALAELPFYITPLMYQKLAAKYELLLYKLMTFYLGIKLSTHTNTLNLVRSDDSEYT